MSKILILTGCAGFIGLNFLKYATSKGIRGKYDAIYSIDKIGYAAKYNLSEYSQLCDNNRIKILNYSIKRFYEVFGYWVNNQDTSYDVINFASDSHVDNSIKSPLTTFEENSSIPGYLIKGLGIEHINKWIQISTDEVYGELPINTKYKKWFKSNSIFHPNNPYAASKAAQDMYLMSMNHTFGMKVQFIRLANQFGPYQHPEKMLPASILRALKGDTIKIYGDGTNIRQWTPVEKSVKIIYDQLFNDSEETLLIAKKVKKLIDNNKVVDIWSYILKVRYGIEVKTEYIENRKGHDTMYALKTTDEVDKYFETPLIKEFENTINHYVTNKDLYLEIRINEK